MASLLAGSWRIPPPLLGFPPADLARITPHLIGAGAAGLAWRHLRNTALAGAPEAGLLRERYRAVVLGTAVHERTLVRAVAALRAKSIEPVVIKGWAVARLYPEAGLRPFGDIDLVVRPEHAAAARLVISELQLQSEIDLHEVFDVSDRTPFDDVWARTRMVTAADCEIRTPCLEDHIRVLCLHLLRHGGWRAIWLCDVAMAVESRPPDFDWDRCFGPSQPEADWVACTIGLAHRLLGARVEATPVAARARSLPPWLPRVVLKHWGAPAPAFLRPLGSAMGSPRAARRAISMRLSDPLVATIRLRGPINRLPRWPFQMLETTGRAAGFLARMPRRRSS